MKKFLIILLISIGVFISIVFVLNIEVTTKQGINYQVYDLRIPLFLKILGFMNRHYNYEQLMKSIVNRNDCAEERAIKIFAWTYKNIRNQPKGLPVVDDHVWHIIIRGYGADDQACDVFTVLCNYANIDAFFSPVYTKDNAGLIPLSFVNINNHWRVFDPHNGVYFKNKAGEFASIEQIRSGDWQVDNNISSKQFDIDYATYLQNLPDIKKLGLRRANIQSPLKRLLFELTKRRE